MAETVQFLLVLFSILLFRLKNNKSGRKDVFVKRKKEKIPTLPNICLFGLNLYFYYNKSQMTLREQHNVDD